MRSGTERRSGPPLRTARPTVALTLAYVVAAAAWAAAGHGLPGGRWLAVHLFTLGAVTNAISDIAPRLAASVAHTSVGAHAGWRRVVRNAGIVAVLVGRTAGPPALVAVGATLLGIDVTLTYRQVRRARRAAPDHRYARLLRLLERACGAFLHGAVLGAMLALGVAWGGAVRLAHVHVMVLGWGVLPVLAVAPMLLPMLARTRADEASEASVLRGLGRAMTAITVAALALLATALWWPARLLAAAAVAVAAVASLRGARHVLRTLRAAPHGAGAAPLAAAVVVVPVALTLDAAALAVGSARLLTAAGAALLAGVLWQAIVAVGAHLAGLGAPARGQRTAAAAAIERVGTLVAIALTAATTTLAVVVADGTRGPWAAAAWAVLVAVGAAHVVRSAVAAR